MSHLVVHDMDTAWTASGPALAITVEAASAPGIGGASNRFVGTGAAADTATRVFAGLDLSRFDELRFWMSADRAADGSAATPFFLEVFYTDASVPGTEFRWFVPVNRENEWEQHTIGLGANPRGQVDSIGFRALPAIPPALPIRFSCVVDELLAVREEMMLDAESALTTELQRAVALPGLSGIATIGTPAAPDAQVMLPLTPGFSTGNRIRLAGGSLGDETFDVGLVTDDALAGTTTLNFAGGGTVAGAFVGPGTVSLLVPAVPETSTQPTVVPTPSVVVTLIDAREALDRTVYFDQRDSFRSAGTVTVCSVRPAPRAYLLDYQLTVAGTIRPQQLFVHDLLLQRLSGVTGLRINGDIAPVWMLPPPPQFVRRLGELSPVYLRIGTHMQIAPRVEQTPVRRGGIWAGTYDQRIERKREELELVEGDL
jgi:hypothetical protein